MKKLLALLLLVVIALALAASGALADHGDAKPKCADLINADFHYESNKSAANVNLDTLTASCKSVTYTLYVLDEPADPTPIATVSARGDGEAFYTTGDQAGRDLVQLSTPVSDPDDDQVCMYATSSNNNDASNQRDRIPDTGCVTVVAGGSGGTPFH